MGRSACFLFAGITILVGALLMCPSPALAQRNALVIQRNLAGLSLDADLILLGKVASVKTEQHPQLQNLTTVVVTLDVIEVLRGAAGRDYTFRQFVPDQHDAESHLDYSPGQEVLLLLHKPSEYGLTSPVGFEQGRFRVSRDAKGNRLVSNGFGNMGLFHGIEKDAPTLQAALTTQTQGLLVNHRSGPISYDQFKEIMRGLNSVRRR